MLSIEDEIFMVKHAIERKKEELEKIDKADPNNRFKYANVKSELNILNQKLNNLNNKCQDGISFNEGVRKKILKKK